LLVADTLLVLTEGAETLTRGVTRAYGDISYFLEEEDATKASVVKEKLEESPDPKPNVIIEERTREKNKKIKNEDVVTKESDRLRHQEELFKQKHEELKAKWDEDKCKIGSTLGVKAFDLSTVQSYSDPKKIKIL
jgi:nucleosome binding factor SPN SPT16 subunit